jgi:hypothetical protein
VAGSVRGPRSSIFNRGEQQEIVIGKWPNGAVSSLSFYAGLELRGLVVAPPSFRRTQLCSSEIVALLRQKNNMNSS